MKIFTKTLWLFAILLFVLANVGWGQVTLATFNFENSDLLPLTGAIGSPVLTGSANINYYSGSTTSPIASACFASANGKYFELTISTSGYNSITINWNARTSSTTSSWVVTANDGTGYGSTLATQILSTSFAAATPLVLGTSFNNNSSIKIKWTANVSASQTIRIDDIVITGTAVAVPMLSVVPGTLTDFTYVQGSGPSTSQNYQLSGSNLSPSTDNITVTGSTNYEVSTDNSTFSSSVNVAYTGGSLSSTNIYVRLESGLSIGDYNSETITNAGGSATTQNVTCSGTVTPTLGLQISSPNTLYTINFDESVSGVNIEQFDGSGFTTSPSDGQLNSYAWEVTGWDDGDLTFGGTRTTENTDYTRGQSNGGVTTGGMYAFLVSTENRALGFQPGGDDWAPGTVTLKIQNQTGTTVTSLSVCYKGYVYNDQGRSNNFNFSHSSDNSTYTDISSLDITSVETAGVPSWESHLRIGDITGISIADDDYYYLRWSGDDVSGIGSRDEFALDDIQIVANPTSTYPTLSGTVDYLAVLGDYSLSGDLTVNKALLLFYALLSLGSNDLTLGSSAVIYGTTSASNMIVATGTGELRKTFTTTGSFTFPVGDENGYYSPVTLNFISGTFSSAYAGVNLRNEKNSNNTSNNDYINRYWTVTQDGISDFSCDVAFYYVDADVVGNENNLYCGSWSGSGWTLLNAVSTSENKLSGTVSSFSAFTGGEQGALPAELTSFTSSTTDNSIHLTWSTAAELNNSGFDVERKKTEDNNWQKIGFVKGHGTTNTPQHYLFSDRFLSTGKYNYRLKQIDFNGNYQYYNLSSEVSIGVPKKFELSQNFPNPFNPVTNISYKLPNDSKVSIKIFDILGREVRTLVSEFKTAGYHTINFDGSTLSSGMYFYRIKTNGFEAIRKMLLIK